MGIIAKSVATKIPHKLPHVHLIPTLIRRTATEHRMSTEIQNLKSFDPFADAQDQDTSDTIQKTQQTNIHIRIQQRNGRKTLTTIEGIPSKFDLKKILKVIKKQFACNGTIVNDEKAGDVIQLQGDQRNSIKDFLVDKEKGLDIDAKTIKVHGF